MTIRISREGRAARPARQVAAGFTLIEVMVTVAIVAILAGVALPSYTSYIQRSKVPPGLDALQSYYTRMEQRFQDTGSYLDGSACGVSVPSGVSNFTITCTVSGTTYTATATGSGPVAGYSYTINSAGVRATTAHPRGVPSTNCWSLKGKTCDA